MSERPVLYGYSPSTYVRTVRMVLADHQIDYDQLQVNVLEGEARSEEHLARNPYGKVPVLDIDGIRLIETEPMCRYICETRNGPTLIPRDAKVRAEMNEAIRIYDNYGYGAILGWAGHFLFPEFVGVENEEAKNVRCSDAKRALALIMKNADPWIVGSEPSLADYFLGPIVFYMGLTPELDRLLELPRMRAWWEALSAHETFKATEPNLGGN